MSNEIFRPDESKEQIESNFELVTGTAHPELAEKVAKILGKNASKAVSRFPDQEARVVIEPNLRKRDVVIIQPTVPPDVDKHWMELWIMADAAKKGSAHSITAVIPYYGYARQDRKDLPRTPITAALMARLSHEAGIDRIMTVDMHSEQSMGSFSEPWDNLYAARYLVDGLIEKFNIPPDSMVFMSPDSGGVKRAERCAQISQNSEVDVNIAFAAKLRNPHDNGDSHTLDMVGDVYGKNVIIVDDLISGGGTIVKASKLAINNGASTVFAIATHGIFSEDALVRIDDSPLTSIVVTDTLPHREDVMNHPKITVVSIAPLLAEAIRRNQTGESLSEIISNKL
jgi:ribose-phosphate pyrophosphokinase